MATRLDTKPPTVPEPLTLAPVAKGRQFSGARLFYAGIAVATIWISVTLASIFSPDLVSGTQQDHVPLAALVDWLWGAAATGSVLLAFRRTAEQGRSVWMAISIGVGAIWLAVALVSIFVPQWLTGTDPTRIPMGALIAPIGGSIATKFIANLVGGETPER
jgi:hypothetical protein